jgi:hypothetical protein
MRNQEEYGKKEKHAIRGEDRSAERCKASIFFMYLHILYLFGDFIARNGPCMDSNLFSLVFALQYSLFLHI